MSTTILFYPYLKASILTPIKQILGITAVFKTTMKGKVGGVNIGVAKNFVPAAIFVLLNIAVVIVGAVTFEASVNAAQVRVPACLPHGLHIL